jgi:FtsH-binding integral membrane protein
MSSDRRSEARVGLASTFRPLIDDRGRCIRRLRPGDLKRAARSENPKLALLANRLRAAMKSEGRRYTPDRVILTLLLIVGVFVAYGIIGGLMIGRMGVAGSLIGLTVFVVLVVVASKGYQIYVVRGALGQIARTAVAEGVCGSCAFSLEGTPADADGAVTCPECGAGWNADRIVAPFWSRPAMPVLRPSVLAWLAPGVRAASALFAPDDRGRYVPCPDSRLLRVRRDLIGEIPADERQELVRSMRRVGRWWRVGLMLLLSWMPAGMLYFVWRIWTEDPMAGVWFFLILALPVLVGVLMVPLSSAFGGPHRTARVAVRHGRCGSCLERLDDAPADDRGRAVCTRCGAAWLTGPATRAAS